MKLTIKIKLLPTEEQKQSLLKTMKAFNQACNWVSEIAFKNKKFGQVGLHKLCYYQIRGRFGLSAQLTVRVIGKVKESYRIEKKQLHTFKQYGAAVYDQRILAFRKLDSCSILSINGRLKIPIAFGSYAKLEQRRVRGQADLIYQKDKFYLAACVELSEPPEFEPKDFIGVDLGVVNIATDSDGENLSGSQINGLRNRYAKLRAKLQSKGTKSAKRLLKNRRRKESRFARDINHQVSKKLVAKAKGTLRGIALENLKGIHQRITVRKAQRRVQHSWAFFQLRKFIEYKARLAGVPIVFIDPRNTSRTCPKCSFVSKNNRKTQALFECIRCGFSGHADVIAAENIRRVAVNQPDVGIELAKLPVKNCASA